MLTNHNVSIMADFRAVDVTGSRRERLRRKIDNKKRGISLEETKLGGGDPMVNRKGALLQPSQFMQEIGFSVATSIPFISPFLLLSICLCHPVEVVSRSPLCEVLFGGLNTSRRDYRTRK